MTPYKVLYNRRCHSPLHWDELGEKDTLAKSFGKELAQKMIEDVQLIKQR